jgi:hypothetical protein
VTTPWPEPNRPLLWPRRCSWSWPLIGTAASLHPEGRPDSLLTRMLTTALDGMGQRRKRTPTDHGLGRARTAGDDLNPATDQKVGGSSPSERAQLSGRFRSWDRPFECRVQQRNTATAVHELNSSPWSSSWSSQSLSRRSASLVTVSGDLGVDLHRAPDPGVPEDSHRDARVNVQRCQERARRYGGCRGA